MSDLVEFLASTTVYNAPPEGVFSEAAASTLDLDIAAGGSSEADRAQAIDLLRINVEGMIGQIEQHANMIKGHLNLGARGFEFPDEQWKRLLAGAAFYVHSGVGLLARAANPSFPAGVLSTDQIEHVTERLSRLQDLAETIAIGLDEEFRSAILQRINSARESLPE